LIYDFQRNREVGTSQVTQSSSPAIEFLKTVRTKKDLVNENGYEKIAHIEFHKVYSLTV